MASADSGGSSRVRLGLILMTIAMLSIPLVDGLAKQLSVSYSPLFLGWARYAVASLIVLPIAAAMHGPRLFPVERRASHVFRTVFLITAMTLYFLSIARIPLATAASTFFVGPIMAAVLPVVVLNERLTSRKALSLRWGLSGPSSSCDPAVPWTRAFCWRWAQAFSLRFI